MSFRRFGQKVGEKCGTRTKTAIDTDVEHGLEIARINHEIEVEAIDLLSLLVQPDELARNNKTMLADKPSSYEQFGSFLTNSSVQLKIDPAVGRDLEKLGTAEGKIGSEERKYILSCVDGVLAHLRQMTGQNKEIVKHRKILRQKRLDMDAYKNHVRKGHKQHEKHLNNATDAFQTQLRVVTELLRSNEWTQKRIRSILKAFVTYQHNFHQTAANILADAIGSMPSDGEAATVITIEESVQPELETKDSINLTPVQ